MRPDLRVRNGGFTLPELMIAMAVGLVLVGGVIAIFLQGRQSFRLDEQVARMQDEARYALQEVARDLRNVAFVGEPLSPVAISHHPDLDIATDCGPAGAVMWAFDLMTPLAAVDDVEAGNGDVADAHTCFDAGEVVPGTDVVAVKRAAGEGVAGAALVDGGTYIRANGVLGLLYTHPDGSAIPVPFTDRRYRVRIYYIRNWSDAEGDGLPSLCRKTLAPGLPPAMETECIARGIQDLQVEYGVDTNADGVPNRFVTDPTAVDLERTVTARVLLLARTDGMDVRHTDTATYTLSNNAHAAYNDNFHRRVYSTTVALYNRKHLLRLGF